MTSTSTLDATPVDAIEDAHVTLGWRHYSKPSDNLLIHQVRPFIDQAENEKYKRKRGFTEEISVRRPWRRRGLARALIARSLLVQKAHGMSESTLSVDSENLSGATRLYEECGFQVVKQNAIYRKALDGAKRSGDKG